MDDNRSLPSRANFYVQLAKEYQRSEVHFNWHSQSSDQWVPKLNREPVQGPRWYQRPWWQGRPISLEGISETSPADRVLDGKVYYFFDVSFRHFH